MRPREGSGAMHGVAGVLLRQLSKVGDPEASPRVTLRSVSVRVHEKLTDLMSSKPDKCGPAARRCLAGASARLHADMHMRVSYRRNTWLQLCPQATRYRTHAELCGHGNRGIRAVERACAFHKDLVDVLNLHILTIARKCAACSL